MQQQTAYRKPRYFFALFGDPNAGKPRVEGGCYPHKGYIRSLGITPGDVVLLYCTDYYTNHPKKAPGIGVVIDATDERVHYQYFPLHRPVDWHSIKANLTEHADRLRVLTYKGNWLWEIQPSTSFRNAIKGSRISWP